MKLVEFRFNLNAEEAMKKADLLIAAGIHLTAMQGLDTLNCRYTFHAEPLSTSVNPQRIIDILDHVKPDTFKIDAINLYQIEEYMNVLHTLLRLAEKMRTLARFVPSEKPEPEKKKSWWKRLWT